MKRDRDRILKDLGEKSIAVCWLHIWTFKQKKLKTRMGKYRIHTLDIWYEGIIACFKSLMMVLSSVQSLSRIQLFATPWTAAHQASLSITNSWRLLKTHVLWVGDAIQPSHPLLSPSPPAFNLSQHQGLFQWVSSSHQVAKVLEFQLQHQSFQWIFRTDFL